MKQEYHYVSIEKLSKLIREQKASPVEIVEACLTRIEKLNPELNAFITVLQDGALEEAKKAEAEIKTGKWRGTLHGIPIGVKDFYDTAGVKTTAAFEHFKDRVPQKDAVAVAKLKAAGAIIIGKTNMHTLGMGTTGLESFFGPVKNPWNFEYIPGGSSSGSAVAIASGMCYATLDTDAVGSCRLPAAVNGVVGFKGSYGLIDIRGILEGTQPPDEFIVWMAHAGITARTTGDVTAMLETLSEYRQREGGRPRIGIAKNLDLQAGVKAVFEKACNMVEKLDFATEDAEAPFWNFNQGIANIKADRKSVADKTFRNIDVLVLPTIPTTTLKVKDVGKDPQALSAGYTIFANYYGLPAISVPCGFAPDGLPVGLQIVGRPEGEGAVFQVAHEYESMAVFHKHPIP